MAFISLIGVGSFMCGVALMYLVMSRTQNKRRLESMDGAEPVAV